MTIDSERLNAIYSTRRFLHKLTDIKLKIKTSEIREYAWSLLKHYPEDYWIDEIRDMLQKRAK